MRFLRFWCSFRGFPILLAVFAEQRSWRFFSIYIMATLRRSWCLFHFLTFLSHKAFFMIKRVFSAHFLSVGSGSWSWNWIHIHRFLKTRSGSGSWRKHLIRITNPLWKLTLPCSYGSTCFTPIFSTQRPLLRGF